MFARPGFPAFDYVRAGITDEVIALLLEHREGARLLMGGTDLFPGLREGIFRPKVIVDVKYLPGMRSIAYDERTGLKVGAAVTMNQLACHPEVQSHYPLLAEAARSVASYQIRNRATLGGNLCNASPCADTAPATLALDAEFVLCGPEGERVVKASEFFGGPGLTMLQVGELMTEIRFPAQPISGAARYLKLGRCKSGDLSLVGVAVLGRADGTPSGFRFRVALGSVAPTPFCATATEEFLADHAPGEETFARAAKMAMAAASPISDVRGSADYQRAMVRALTQRGLGDVWSQLKGEE